MAQAVSARAASTVSGMAVAHCSVVYRTRLPRQQERLPDAALQ